jgi:hypothetical protein
MMKYAMPIVLAMLLAACGGDPYKAPPTGNGTAPANSPKQPVVPTKKPTGPSYADDYRREADAALSSWKMYGGDKSAENFAKVGTHLYNAQRFKIMSSRNGHSTDNFHKSREVGQLFTDWKKTFQAGDWEKDPDYQAAKKAYDEVQQTE